MSAYHYSPATGEIIHTDTPADWMGGTDVAPPAYDPATVGCFWRGDHWEIVQAPPPVQPSLAPKVDALWRAADAVVSGSISGVALSILTIGVLQSKPKALAVAAWSKSIWAEYYARKALVTADSVDDLDFSSFGPMPATVPDLQAEIGL